MYDFNRFIKIVDAGANNNYTREEDKKKRGLDGFTDSFPPDLPGRMLEFGRAIDAVTQYAKGAATMWRGVTINQDVLPKELQEDNEKDDKAVNESIKKASVISPTVTDVADPLPSSSSSTTTIPTDTSGTAPSGITTTPSTERKDDIDELKAHFTTKLEELNDAIDRQIVHTMATTINHTAKAVVDQLKEHSKSIFTDMESKNENQQKTMISPVERLETQRNLLEAIERALTDQKSTLLGAFVELKDTMAGLHKSYSESGNSLQQQYITQLTQYHQENNSLTVGLISNFAKTEENINKALQNNTHSRELQLVQSQTDLLSQNINGHFGELTKTLETIKNSSATLTQTKSDEIDKLKSQVEKYEQMQKEGSKAAQKSEIQVRELKNNKKRLEDQIQTLKNQFESILQGSEEQRKEIGRAVQEKAELQEKVKNLEVGSGVAMGEVANLRGKVAELQSQKEQIEKEKEHILQAASGQIHQKEALLNEAVKEGKRLEQYTKGVFMEQGRVIQEKEATVGALSVERSQLQNERTILHNQLGQLAQEKERVERELAERQEKLTNVFKHGAALESMYAQLAKSYHGLFQSHSSQADQMQRMGQELNNQMQERQRLDLLANSLREKMQLSLQREEEAAKILRMERNAAFVKLQQVFEHFSGEKNPHLQKFLEKESDEGKKAWRALTEHYNEFYKDLFDEITEGIDSEANKIFEKEIDNHITGLLLQISDSWADQQKNEFAQTVQAARQLLWQAPKANELARVDTLRQQISQETLIPDPRDRAALRKKISDMSERTQWDIQRLLNNSKIQTLHVLNTYLTSVGLSSIDANKALAGNLGLSQSLKGAKKAQLPPPDALKLFGKYFQ